MGQPNYQGATVATAMGNYHTYKDGKIAYGTDGILSIIIKDEVAAIYPKGEWLHAYTVEPFVMD